MKLSYRDQLIVIGVLIALVAVAMVFLLVLPQFNKIAEIGSKLGQAQADMAEAKALLARRQEAKQQAAVTEAALLKLANELPESPEVPSLIIELQDVVNDSGLATFTRIMPAGELTASDDGTYSIVTMNIDVSGTWSDYVAFLQKLQKLSRQVRVVKFIVSPANQPADDGEGEEIVRMVEGEMTLEVYTMTDADQAAAVPPPPPSQ